MKNRYLCITVIYFVCIANRCVTRNEFNNRIRIINKTNYDIYCVPGYYFPDTTLKQLSKDNIMANSGFYQVRAHDTTTRTGALPLCYSREWTRVMNSNTLIIFVLKKDVIDKIEWQTIVEHDLVYKRMYLTHQDMMKNNCTVVIK